jgi:hypothetical protein
MIIIVQGQKYRPGDDEALDDTIRPSYDFDRQNYIPSRAELLEDTI